MQRVLSRADRLSGGVMALLMLSVCAAIDDLHAASGNAPEIETPAGLVAGGGQIFRFDLPALPLEEALDRYARITGLPAMFPSDLMAGRRSAGVRGDYPADAALQMLLHGTGLEAVRHCDGRGSTFVLRETGLPAHTQVRAASPSFMDAGYAGQAQARIWQRLCSEPALRPGSYTALLQLRVSDDGLVEATRVLGGSGDAGRDAALVRRLDGLSIPGEVPDVLQGQPLTIVILPSDPGGPQCGSGMEWR